MPVVLEPKTKRVKGYTKKDGTHVKGYTKVVGQKYALYEPQHTVKPKAYRVEGHWTLPENNLVQSVHSLGRARSMKAGKTPTHATMKAVDDEIVKLQRAKAHYYAQGQHMPPKPKKKTVRRKLTHGESKPIRRVVHKSL